MSLFEAVRTFHQKFNLPIANTPRMLNQQRFEFRCQLHYEEQKELESAFAEQDLVKIADGLGDLLFVIAGTCLEFGLPMDKIIEAITKANMNKEQATPKPKKLPGWVGPEEEIHEAIALLFEKL